MLIAAIAVVLSSTFLTNPDCASPTTPSRLSNLLSNAASAAFKSSTSLYNPVAGFPTIPCSSSASTALVPTAVSKSLTFPKEEINRCIQIAGQIPIYKIYRPESQNTVEEICNIINNIIIEGGK